MSALKCKAIGLGFLVASCLWPITASACNVPVYRYALERWEADPYVVVVFHRDPLTAEQQALVDALEKTSNDGLANLAVGKVNVSEKMSDTVQALWKLQGDLALPWMVVRYPPQLGVQQPVWAGPLGADIVKSLVDSPARREIARSLLKGETAALVLLESGNKKRDDAAAHLLETQSKKLAQTLELPEPDPTDPVMNTNLASKIAFSVVRVSRSNPAERMLLNMLLNVDTNLVSATEEMLFPVFGRGRALPPAIGKDIQEETITAMGEFLSGACSCQVKEMNPGYDLLLAANWNALFDGEPPKDVEFPPLIGLSQFVAPEKPTASPDKPAASADKTPLDGKVAAMAAIDPAPAGGGSLVRNVLIVLGGGLVVLAGATFALRAGARKT